MKPDVKNDVDACFALANKLKIQIQKNNIEYQQLLERNTHEIIKDLGGLHNVLQHCLHDQTYIDQHLNESNINKLNYFTSIVVHQSQISVLENLMSSTSTRVVKENEMSVNCSSPNTQTVDYKTTQIANMPHLSQIKTTSTDVSDIVCFDNTSDYKHGKDAIKVDSRNNLYFKCLPFSVASILYYVIIGNRRFPLSLLLFFVIFLIISSIGSWIYGTESLIYQIFYNIAWGIALVLEIAFCLSLNIDICHFIFRTFDFWFKIYNTILVLISFTIIYVIYGDVSVFSGIFSMIILLQGSLLLFLIDGFLSSNYIKMVFLIVGILYCIYLAIVTYFYQPDLGWNPFQSYSFGKHSNVNFKYLYISGIIDVAIFLMKPLNRYIKIYLKLRKRDHDSAVDDIINPNDIQLNAVYLYKRPCLQWQNVEYPKTDDGEQLANAIANTSNN